MYPSFFDSFYESGVFGGAGPFGVIFMIIFGLIVCTFLVILVKGIGQWHKNNRSPRLSVPAVVVAKRLQVHGGSGESSAHTSYYVTFQVESGDRMELSMDGEAYGMLAEGDGGRLTFQGTCYLGFERI